MPYDEQDKDDPRPLLLGEYFFPVCHEQTDVRIDPGLREFYGFGHSDPDSAFGRQCAESFTKPFLKPCMPPGAWSHIVHSQRVMGAGDMRRLRRVVLLFRRQPRRICLAPRLLGTDRRLATAQARVVAGENDFLAGLVPRAACGLFGRTSHDFFARGESLLLHRLRRVDIGRGRSAGKRATCGASVAPGKSGAIEIPIPHNTPEGAKLIVRVSDAKGNLINAASIQLGRRDRETTPAAGGRPSAISG